MEGDRVWIVNRISLPLAWRYMFSVLRRSLLSCYWFISATHSIAYMLLGTQQPKRKSQDAVTGEEVGRG